MLAHRLEDLDHHVTMIDADPTSFIRLGPDFAGDTVAGIGFDREVLRRAGIQGAEAFAAVSSGDNSNILAARVVREYFGVTNVVARIYDPGRADVYERLGIPTVASVRWSTDRVLRRLLPAGSEPLWRDPSGQVQLAQVRANSGWVGTPVARIEQLTGARVPFLLRMGEGIVPGPRTLFQDGDLLYLAMPDNQAADIEALMARTPPS